MSLESFLENTIRINDSMRKFILSTLHRHQIKDVETLCFVKEQSLPCYFQNRIHIDIMVDIIEAAKAFVSTKKPEKSKKENGVVFDIDLNLLLHDNFCLLAAELKKKRVFASYRKLIISNN